MKTPLLIIPLAIASLALGTASLQAAAEGFDSGSSSAYSGGWINGSNGGSGFGAWQLPANSLYSATIANSNGNSGTPSIGASAFRFARNSSASGSAFQQAIRPFAIGGSNNSQALDVGQTFKFDFDLALSPADGQSFGFFLRDVTAGSNEDRWGFEFRRNGSNTRIVLFSGTSSGGLSLNTTIPISALNNGAQASFTLGASGTWNAAITTLGTGGATYNFSNATSGLGLVGTNINGFRLFYANGATGGVNNYINNIAVVPEPAAFAGLGLALGVVAVMRRRRRLQS